MTLMNWSTDLDLGVRGMDSEHRGLVDAMNKIHDLDASGADKATLDAAITKLADLTTRHFANEERHMASIAFPDLKSHAFIHQQMLTKFTELYTAFKAGPGKIDKAFFDFLKFWLRSHIMGIDRKYSVHGKPVKV